MWKVESNISKNDFEISHILSAILDFNPKKKIISKMFSITVGAQRKKIHFSKSEFINDLVF